MEKKLFDDFQPVSAKAWKQQIQYALKGADYNKNMIYESLEGIPIKPFYHADDLEKNVLDQPNVPETWAIGQELFVADAKRTNTKALKALERGVESLLFNIPSEKIAVKTLINGIDMFKTPLHFKSQFLSKSYAEQILKATTTATRSFLHLDPIGHFVQSGNWYTNQATDLATVSEILKLSKAHSNTSILSVDASLYQNAGATMVQQLAYALAHSHEYLHFLAPPLIKGITFKIAVGSNYFFEIAKVRALRLLWRTLAETYDIAPDCHIVATPTRRNKTLYSPNTNMLRTTTECMSAILGGADTICNAPYDAIYHKDNDFGERLARNQLLLLKHESHYNQVAHAAGGAYYIETLTQQLAQKALDLFKTIEASGGYLKQLKTGVIQRKISESAQKEQLAFDAHNEILVGTNAFQKTTETVKDTLELYPFVKTNPRKTLIVPIIPKRLAEATEQQRLKEE
ncbi:methylmalonyl-CoA mutase subunit beta [Kriegella aquimaris]|uniref:Methylmalonyl-CoA mutase n=1 Tax=Kriegella aquimaris TaxID=192904 RepID=A0A1G9U5D4_9FLAO|nr:methylmalonyl-CoA mutase subunit beta [Kriegella aquimaris]SDM55072.1 methylmalonyl-CoA mutase [Kriegella aquimaris]